MNEMIEKLKKNKIAFGLMSPEEQELLRKANTSNCLFYNPGGNWLTIRCDMDFDRDRIYAIKPDYQPEPEFVDLEITKHAEGTLKQTWWLGVWADERVDLPHAFTHLHCLPSLPGFRYFWYINLAVGTEARIHFAHVAKKIDEGKTVYAKLRRV